METDFVIDVYFMMSALMSQCKNVLDFQAFLFQQKLNVTGKRFYKMSVMYVT